jgi:hypothetical protein
MADGGFHSFSRFYGFAAELDGNAAAIVGASQGAECFGSGGDDGVGGRGDGVVDALCGS